MNNSTAIMLGAGDSIKVDEMHKSGTTSKDKVNEHNLIELTTKSSKKNPNRKTLTLNMAN